MSAYSDHKVGALSDEEFKQIASQIDEEEDYDYDSPCDECPEKWMDNKQFDCPWHLDNKRCDCY